MTIGGACRTAVTILLQLSAMGCALHPNYTEPLRVNDYFSYYEPSDNLGNLGPDYLVGPPSMGTVRKPLPPRGASALLPAPSIR